MTDSQRAIDAHQWAVARRKSYDELLRNPRTWTKQERDQIYRERDRWGMKAIELRGLIARSAD